jgi:hypothetical protein
MEAETTDDYMYEPTASDLYEEQKSPKRTFDNEQRTGVKRSMSRRGAIGFTGISLRESLEITSFFHGKEPSEVTDPFDRKRKRYPEIDAEFSRGIEETIDMLASFQVNDQPAARRQRTDSWTLTSSTRPAVTSCSQ